MDVMVFFRTICHHISLVVIEAQDSGLFGELDFPNDCRLGREVLFATLLLDGNGIRAVWALPGRFALSPRVGLSRNPILINSIGHKVWQAADVHVDLLMVDLQTNGDQQVFFQGEKCRNYEKCFRARQHWLQVNMSGGFHCLQVEDVDKMFEVTPSLFAPNALCECMEGYAGHSINCSKCSEGFSLFLQSLPPAETAGRKTVHGHRGCACPPGFSYEAEHKCEPCGRLNLQCPNATLRNGIQPFAKPGFVRIRNNDSIAFGCHGDPNMSKERCPGMRGVECGKAYGGILCQSCTENAVNVRGRCRICTDNGLHRVVVTVAAFVLVITMVPIAILFMYQTKRVPFQKPKLAQLKVAFIKQCVMLLWAYLQLLSVVSRLHTTTTTSRSEILEQPILSALLVSADSIKDAASLECRVGYKTAQTISKMSTPLLLPVLVLVTLIVTLCIGKQDLGIIVSIRLIRTLMIGGLVGSFDILECTHVDSLGHVIGEELAYMSTLPFIPCMTTFAGIIRRCGHLGSALIIVGVPILFGWIIADFWTTTANYHCRATNTDLKVLSNGSLKITVSHVLPHSLVRKRDGQKNYELFAAGASLVAAMVADVGCEAITIVVDQNSISLCADCSNKEDRIEFMMERYFRLAQSMGERNACDAAPPNPLRKAAKKLFEKYSSSIFTMMDLFFQFAKIGIVVLVEKNVGVLSVTCLCGFIVLLTHAQQPFIQRKYTHMVMVCYSCIGIAAIAFRKSDFPGAQTVLRFCYVLPLIFMVVSLRNLDIHVALADSLRQDFQMVETQGHIFEIDVSSESLLKKDTINDSEANRNKYIGSTAMSTPLAIVPKMQ